MLDKIVEGLMKRSDPIVSGEQDEPVRPKKKTPFQARLSNLARTANVSEDKVRDLWIKHSGDVDPKNMNRFAIITSRVKKDLGL